MMTSFTDRARERGVALSFTERKRNRIAEDQAEQARRAKTLTNLSQGSKTPIDQLPPQQRDQAEQARRSKMGTTKNMTPETITSIAPPKPTLLQKVGSFAKGVITDPLGTLDRIDQSQFGKDIMAGVGQANKSTANVLKSIGGDKVPIVKDALSGIDKMSDPLIQQGGTGILSQVTQSLPRAASNMGLAFLSGGASVPAQLGGNATLQAAKQVLTSPTFVNSMLQSYGGAYGQAREEGADRPQAITKAVLQAFPEALIEQAGGVEQLPANMAKQGLLKTIAKSALEEGAEEIFQYPFEALAKKATYAPNTPFFSMTENAVINPKDMAQGAIVGGLAGGLLGGGAKAVTGDISLPKFKRDVQQTRQQAAQQTPIQAEQIQPVFYTDPYGNVTTDLNQAPLLLPEAKQTAKPQMPTAEELAILNNPTTEIDTETNFPKLDHLSVSEVNSLITELKNDRQKILDEQVNWLKNSMGQGVEQGGIVRDMWGDVVDRFGRTSNNEYWYQQWAKKNNYRKPTKAELYEIAEQQLYEGVQANDTFIPPNEEFIQTDEFINYAESQLNSAKRKSDIQNRLNEYEEARQKEFYAVPFEARREAPFTAVRAQQTAPIGNISESVSNSQLNVTPSKAQQDFTPIGGKPEPNIPQGEKLLSFPQTMADSDTTAAELKQMIKDNPLSYEPINNVDTLKYAQQIVDQNFEAAKRIVMEGESFSNATESAMAQDIIRRLQNEKKWDDAFDVMEATARKGKTSGQIIQLFSMWRRMTPEGMLKYADRVFRQTGTKMTAEFADRLTDSMKRIEGITDPKQLQRAIMNKAGQMPEWAYQSMSKKTTEQLQDIAMAQVLMDISNEIPKSAWRKVSSVQAMSHLINIKTALRNILGNLSFGAAEKVSNAVAVPVDVIASKFTGKRSLTTPQFKGTFKAGFKQAKEAAFDAALGIDRTGINKGKYNVPIGGTFKKGSIGSSFEKIMSYELNVPDEFFKGQIYSDVLQQQMKMAGVTEPTADMIDYANARAKYATFQDDSLPARILQGLKDVLNLAGGGEFKTGKSGIKTHEFGLGDFLIKYTTVPGNLISRSLEYTPAGLAKILTIANDAKLSNAVKQSEIAMTIGRTLTGTSMIAFAALLNRLGLLISEDKDRGKNAQALDQAEGLGNYKVNVTALERMLNGEDTKPQAGDLLQSYNWIEPLGVLLAIGAEVDKQISDKDKSVPAALFAIGNAAMEEVLDLPTLSVIRQMTYQDNAFDVAMTPLVQGVSGFVPGPIRQIAQMQDPVARLTKSDSQGGAILNRIKTSLPSVNIGGVEYGRKSLEPKINAWGQEVTYPGGVFNTFINPGQTSTYQPSEVTPQLKQLEEITGKTDFYPRFTAPYSFTHKKQTITLTPEEKTLYMRLEGEEVHRRFKEILANGVTESTAEETIKELNKAKDKASSMARDEILKNRGLK